METDMIKRFSGFNKYLVLLLVLILTLCLNKAHIVAQDFPDPARLIQARKTVQMIDQLFKTFIILIDEEYVKDPSTLPAATLSKKVFKIMKDKGWYNIRLLDATGTPFNPENNPQDRFERDAIKAISSGKPYFERVEKIKGRNYLRAATKLSAISEGCIKCHPLRKLGDIVGAFSYSIPLD